MPSDNIKVAGSGIPGAVDVATDEISGVHYPIYKLAGGADGEVYLAYVDQFSGAVGTIEQEHLQIHKGNGYQLSGEIAALGTTDSAYFLIDPVSPIHWRDYRIFADDAPLDIELFENPTTTVNGTALTPLNRNRLSSNTATAAVYSGPTVTDDGDRLYISRIVGTGTGANTTGEVEGLPVEWIIDGGNTYLLKITNNSGGNVDLIYQFFWYEG